MIDLTRTEAQMLAEVRTGANGEARIDLSGKTPDELLPSLIDTFSRRYESLPSDRVYGELSYLVKKGLGNAYKWGNECAPDRALTVRAVMTDLGAVVAISDQGQGFDVPNVLARFLRNDGYSRHGGSGFFHFHESASLVSYADGGRTLLIRFLSPAESPLPAADEAHKSAAKSKSRHAELAQLASGSQVKIKGGVRPDGRFVAEKISLKAPEAWGVVDGVIRAVSSHERRIRVANATVRLPESAEIMSPEQRRLEFDALTVGQAVELIGSYSPEQGLLPLKVQIRHGSASQQFEEIQGKIDSINEADATFSVLGITVATDEKTQIKDKRH
jgi:hypothetical protein